MKNMKYANFLIILHISTVNASCATPTCHKILVTTQYLKDLILINMEKLNKIDNKMNIILNYIPPSSPPFPPNYPPFAPFPPTPPPNPINPIIIEESNLIDIIINLFKKNQLLFIICIIIIILLGLKLFSFIKSYIQYYFQYYFIKKKEQLSPIVLFFKNKRDNKYNQESLV